MKTRLGLLFLLFALFMGCSNSSEPPENPEPAIPEGAFIEGEQFTDLEIFAPFGSDIRIETPVLSPNGKKLAYHLVVPGTDSSGIYIRDLDTEESTLLVPGVRALDPAFSPDNEWLVFSLNWGIYKIKINGDSLTQLTQNEDRSNFYPGWSPKGDLIVYEKTRTNEFGNAGSWIMQTDGSDRSYLLVSGRPSWFPDGERIFTRSGTTVDLEGRILQDLQPDQRGFLRAYVSLNSQRIVYPETNGVWILNLEEGIESKKRILPSHGTSENPEKKVFSSDPFWHPDGESIIYAQYEVLKFEVDNSDFGQGITRSEGINRVYIVNAEDAIKNSNLP